MIAWFVVPLLWTCPGVRLPVIGEVGGSIIAKTPSRNLICQPYPGVQERYDHLNDALARIRELGAGQASLSLCDPGGSPCKRQEIEWDSNPSVKEIRR